MECSLFRVVQKTVSFVIAVGTLVTIANASNYYVAVDGDDSNVGSLAEPFATLNKANSKVAAGDTVFIRGGTYYPVDTVYVSNDKMFAGIYLNKSGESDERRIHYVAFPGEIPIFDFSKMPVSDSYNTAPMYTPGFLIQAQYIHIKGIEVCNVPMIYNSNTGVMITRSKHVFLEQVNSHHNKGSGFFVNDSKGSGGHYFLNCDSHDNYDPNGRQGDGENADGFGVHYQTAGDTTKFFGCRAWWNSDDGWDFINQEFPVVVENSFAMGHGYSNYGTSKPANANGNGFKAGSSKTGNGRHILRNNVAWKNKAAGFYANHSSIGNYWYNNTSYRNNRAFNMWASSWDASGNRTDGVVLSGSNAHVMKNNIAVPNTNSYIGGDYASGEYNSWNLDLNATDADFVSVDDPSMTVTGMDISNMAGALGPRLPDGSLPETEFLKLSAKSQFVDRGVDVGLPYTYKAPDLGAYEYAESEVNSSSGGVIISSSSEIPVESSSSAFFEGLSSEYVMEASSSSEDLNPSTAVYEAKKSRRLDVRTGKSFYANGRVLDDSNSSLHIKTFTR